MGANILIAIGGLGLFLIGMIVLTDSLRALAGGALRRVLTRFTTSPVTGAAAGAVTTAVIQSSSATTVTAVGFVGAGLLTFPQALGVIFGANIGTTITGWLVAVVGFKLQLGVAALPLVLIGVLLRLFGRGRARHIGWALAGFALLFIGIDTLQQGLVPLEGQLTPSHFPDDTLIGRAQLVAIGIALTVVTQSSSAGVATAMVALATGTISFPQAAAMVIGMDVGTTFTALLATLGGSTAMRQTGVAHVIYNLMTGVMAFVLLGPYFALAGAWAGPGNAGNAQIALVAFHTSFNTLGVIAILPFTRHFARLITWLIPERGSLLVRHLDTRLLVDAAAAADAAVATTKDISAELTGLLVALVDTRHPSRPDAERLESVAQALAATQGFVQHMHTDEKQAVAHRKHIAVMHALDHLNRLQHRCTQTERIETLRGEPRLRRLSCILRAVAGAPDDAGDAASREIMINRVRSLMRRQRHAFRTRTMDAAAHRRVGPETALLRLDAVRWLHRVAYHLWRIRVHLNEAEREDPPQADAADKAVETAQAPGV